MPKFAGFVETFRRASLYEEKLISSILMSCLNNKFSSKDVSIFGLKAKGFLIRIYSLAYKRSSSWPEQLLQPSQAQLGPQCLLFAKHSQ
jgi:hypothetical protein